MSGETTTQLTEGASEVVLLPRCRHETASSYGVVFKGRLCSPSWWQKGPAQAYLDALIAGTRKPEYSS